MGGGGKGDHLGGGAQRGEYRFQSWVLMVALFAHIIPFTLSLLHLALGIRTDF